MKHYLFISSFRIFMMDQLSTYKQKPAFATEQQSLAALRPASVSLELHRHPTAGPQSSRRKSSRSVVRVTTIPWWIKGGRRMLGKSWPLLPLSDIGISSPWLVALPWIPITPLLLPYSKNAGWRFWSSKNQVILLIYAFVFHSLRFFRVSFQYARTITPGELQ